VIVSHRWKFIFLKTRKTAGTSVEIALSRHCGPDDIITPLTEVDEVLRAECGGRAPQHFKPPYGPHTPHDLDVSPQVPDRAYNHMPAWMVRQIVGDKIWEDYYKFVIDRNPWDAGLSMYLWRLGEKHTSASTLDAFIAEGGLDTLRRNIRLYRLGSEIAVDRVCRYETLTKDLAEVWQRLGLPGSPDLPNAKSSYRTDEQRRSYREMYTPAAAAEVQRMFDRSINELEYDF